MIKEHEREVLAQFRKEVVEEGIISDGDTIGTDDYTFLRFLRARKYKIEDAKKMIANCQEWRRTVEGVGLDALYDEIDPLDYPEREIVAKHWPFYYHKTDKEGHPIHIEAFGKLDVNALLREVDGDRQWKTLLTSCEFGPREIFPACSKAKGSPIASSLCLVDVKGFSIQKFWSAKSYLKLTFQIAQDYYPESLAKLIIINAPTTFTFMWSIVKAWLAPETTAKVVILGSDYESFLLEYVDKENLPTEYGGTCMCEGLGGCALSGAGPWLEGRVYNGRGPSRFKPKSQQEKDGGETELESDKEKVNDSIHEADAIVEVV